jgi:hypothetical protein
MPNISIRIGQYCIFHGIIHKDEYLECDFCNEHKDWICLKDRYYNYGYSRRSYLACMECHDTLFGPFKLGQVDVMERAYESILEVINDMTEKKGHESIDYYEAARIAYNDREYMRKYIDSPIDITEIDKGFRRIWQFTYRIVSGEEKERVKVVNKDPDNLLVSWVPGGMTITEILKAMGAGPVRL